MALGDDDIPTMLAELGVDVTFGGNTVKGIVRQFNETEHEFPGAGELVTRAIVVTIKTGSLGVLPGPPPGAALTVDSVNHKVLASMAREHGVLTQILCQVVDANDWATP